MEEINPTLLQLGAMKEIITVLLSITSLLFAGLIWFIAKFIKSFDALEATVSANNVTSVEFHSRVESNQEAMARTIRRIDENVKDHSDKISEHSGDIKTIKNKLKIA